MTKKIPYGRNEYPSRGIRRERDFIYEGIVAPSCIICGQTLQRKTYNNGRLETLRAFSKRKTCGISKEGERVCLNKLIKKISPENARKRVSTPEKKEQWLSRN